MKAHGYDPLYTAMIEAEDDFRRLLVMKYGPHAAAARKDPRQATATPDLREAYERVEETRQAFMEDV